MNQAEVTVIIGKDYKLNDRSVNLTKNSAENIAKLAGRR